MSHNLQEDDRACIRGGEGHEGWLNVSIISSVIAQFREEMTTEQVLMKPWIVADPSKIDASKETAEHLKPLPGKDYGASRCFIIPCQLIYVHWIVIRVDVHTRTAICYDSLDDGSTRTFKNIISESAKMISAMNSLSYDERDWKFHAGRSNKHPAPSEGGVASLMNISSALASQKRMTRDIPLARTLTAKDSRIYRKQIEMKLFGSSAAFEEPQRSSRKRKREIQTAQAMNLRKRYIPPSANTKKSKGKNKAARPQRGNEVKFKRGSKKASRSAVTSSSKGSSPFRQLSYSQKSGELMQFSQQRKRKNLHLALLRLCEKDDAKGVKALFEKIGSVMTSNLVTYGDNKTALQVATRTGSYNVIRVLMDKHCAMLKLYPHGLGKTIIHSALISAIKGRDFAAVKLMVSKLGSKILYHKKGLKSTLVKADKDIRKYIEKTTSLRDLEEQFFHTAVSKGHIVMVKYLLEEAKADVNSLHGYGNAAIFKAVRSNDLEMVKTLVESKADLTIKTRFDEMNTPRRYAQKVCYVSCIAEYLLEQELKEKIITSAEAMKVKAEINRKKLSRLCTSCTTGDLNKVVEIMESDVERPLDINELLLDRYPSCALHIASSYGNLSIVRYLIKECRAYVHTRDFKNDTALILATRRGYPEVIKYLCDVGGAELLKIVGSTKLRAREVAETLGHSGIIRFLIVKEVECGLISAKHGKMLQKLIPSMIKEHELRYSAEGRNISKMTLALNGLKSLQKRCPYIRRIDSFSERGLSAFHICCVNGYMAGMKTLMEWKASIHLKTRKGETPLMLVAKSTSFRESVKILLDAGVETSHMKEVLDCKSKIPWKTRFAIYSKLHSSGKLSRSRKARCVNDIETFLCEAKGDLDIKILPPGISYNINCKKPMPSYSTPLINAVKTTNTSMVKAVLLQKGDVEVRDHMEITPLCWAVRYGDFSIVRVLVQAGADLTATCSFFRTPMNASRYADFYEYGGIKCYLTWAERKQRGIAALEKSVPMLQRHFETIAKLARFNKEPERCRDRVVECCCEECEGYCDDSADVGSESYFDYTSYDDEGLSPPHFFNWYSFFST
eukprot:CAMPEP_0167743570 /NCGR_PEP_ID=MMETSP0110_2-20121227/2087_1 /TAXON_ID=629695 /ORGANISM="Gymnochlora sp., Strain CCMP2014" /LENGTH=1071 /DNA_ID=CAMNT_0007627951 /DNA_START=147 /DNA_END=3363 /DNA_ORIENTATION=-